MEWLAQSECCCLPDVGEVGREVDGHGTAVEFDFLEGHDGCCLCRVVFYKVWLDGIVVFGLDDILSFEVDV